MIHKINFLTGERVVFEKRPHWLLLVSELMLLVAGLVAAALGLPEIEHVDIPLKTIFAILLVITGTLIFLDWWFTRFYLTNIRLIKTRGIIGKSSITIPLDKIQDIEYEHGIAGRIFGYGDLVIESAGGYGRLQFRYIPKPWRVRESIQQAIEAERKTENT